MKYAHLEKNTNKILGWYDKKIHKTIPTPNVEVSDEVWQKAICININAYENGKFVIKDFRTEKEISKQESKAKIVEHESYLSSTDWITAKYNDEVVVLENITKADFVAKYQDVYTARQNARNEINKLEKELESL